MIAWTERLELLKATAKLAADEPLASSIRSLEYEVRKTLEGNQKLNRRPITLDEAIEQSMGTCECTVCLQLKEMGTA